ncbi:MAG TPA: hypothetical protein VNQ33_07635 [Acidimicrobiales bacterium]|nr:hypothetical protein [Acidimicrobiales bacterium]
MAERPSSPSDRRPPDRRPPDRRRPAAKAPRRHPIRRFNRRIPGWSVPIVIIGVLLVAELGARVIGPDITRKAGTEERLFVKSDQIYQRGADRTDVVVFGSSETAGGLVPTTMAKEVPELPGIYNAALAGSSVSLMHEWAQRIVVPQLHPDVAVIGLLPMQVMKIDVTGAQGPEEALAAYRVAIEQVDPGGVGDLGWELRQRSDLIRYRPYLRSPEQAADGAWTALHGGLEVTPEDLEADAAMDWTKETDPGRVARTTEDDGSVHDYWSQSLPVDADALGGQLYQRFGQGTVDLAALDAFVTDLEAAGVTPVIALAPVDRGPLTKGGADLTPLDDVSRQVEAWGKERGIAVDNQFTQDWPSHLFHDRNHLDREGAKRWSTEVGSWLAELCGAGEIPACAGG